MRVGLGISLLAGAALLMVSGQASAATADIQWPDTGQSLCYDNDGNTISCGSAVYPGQDGDNAGPARSYTNNGTTVTDNVTGLLWQQDGSVSGALTLAAAGTYATGLSLPGCTSWDLPTTQQLSSLINASVTLDDDGLYGPFDIAGYYSHNYWTKTDNPAGDHIVVQFRFGDVLGASSESITTAHVLAVCQD